MGKHLILGAVVTILCLPCGVARAEDERGRVDLRTRSVTVSEDMFVEKTPVGRGAQIVEETIKGAGKGALEGAGIGAVEGLIASGGTPAAPAMAAGGAMIGAVQSGLQGAANGAVEGATEPTEYREFDTRKTNQGLQDRWTDTNYRR